MTVYISQPTYGLSSDEVANRRNEAIKRIHAELGEDAYILDTKFTHMQVPSNSKATLWDLGNFILSLSFADYVYFCKDWEKSRECQFIHLAAVTYGVEGIYEKGSNNYGD